MLYVNLLKSEIKQKTSKSCICSSFCNFWNLVDMAYLLFSLLIIMSTVLMHFKVYENTEYWHKA